MSKPKGYNFTRRIGLGHLKSEAYEEVSDGLATAAREVEWEKLCGDRSRFIAIVENPNEGITRLIESTSGFPEAKQPRLVEYMN